MVDFRDLIFGLPVLQYGSLEEKLKFAFLAYDLDHTQEIDKKEFFMLIKSSSEVQNIRFSNHEVNELVDKIFLNFDADKNGKLSFTEFKGAIESRLMAIKPFWVSTIFKFSEELFKDHFR